MNSLRTLLAAAVPELSTPDDRVTEVRNRATRLQRRRRSIVAGVATLVIIAAAALSPIVLRDEPVVAAGAVRATMYLDFSLGSWPTDPVINRDITPVVTALNSLSSRRPPDLGCNLALRPNYRMRFEYPDGSDRMVVFDMNCGTVQSGDVVRYGKVTKALDAFAEAYRAQGGELPDSPW